ncbi:MAG: D-2-hydroxyacid dehydrogenase [Verrucomicrobiota bacterium]
MNTLRIFVDFAITPDILELLQAGTRGHQLVFPKTPVTSVLAKAEPDPLLATADIAFGQPDPQALAEPSPLKWIHISSSSITRYDTPAFRALMAQRNIAVTNSASVYSDACATQVLSFMLAQARNLPLALRTRTANGTPAWHSLRSTSIPLQGATVLVLGYGTIGKRLVELLRPFDVNVIAYRRKARGDEGVPVITSEQLAHTLATKADHIVNLLPDSAETRHFFNAQRFAHLKPGAVFYNIGRGATVDQEALREALHTGRLQAAWLDVTEPEPLPEDHPLWQEPHCYITPHIAGGHKDETKTLVRHFLHNFTRFTRGEPLKDQVM